MRPAPIADVPPAAIADGIAPAKGWLLALMAARELHDAPAIPTAELARDAPKLCAAILRAVGSDAELDLAPLAARAGAMAGAGSAASAVAAVGHLRAALWEALVEAMRPLDAATTAALAERLAWVCDHVAVASVGRAAGAHDRGSAAAVGDVAFHLRDARRDWRAAVDRYAREGRAFALVALEVDDAQRLLAADPDGGRAVLDRAEGAVRAELRPHDVLDREPDGRLYVIAPDLGAPGGRSLAKRLAAAIAAAAAPHGVPLTASIGVATSPADGTDAEALAARADEELFAARAAGVAVAED